MTLDEYLQLTGLKPMTVYKRISRKKMKVKGVRIGSYDYWYVPRICEHKHERPCQTCDTARRRSHPFSWEDIKFSLEFLQPARPSAVARDLGINRRVVEGFLREALAEGLVHRGWDCEELLVYSLTRVANA